MKKIFVVLIFLLLVACDTTETNYNEFSRDMLNLKGDVLSFEQEIFDMKTAEKVYFDVFEMGYFGSSNITYEFDERGNAKTIIEKTPEGRNIVTWSSEYDDKNVLKIFRAQFEEMEDYNQISYDLDDKGNVIINNHVTRGVNQLIHNDQVLEEYNVAITHDEYGRVIRTSHDIEIYGLEGQPLYDYNTSGQISDVYWYDAAEKICHVTINYNEKGYMASYDYVINPMTEVKNLSFDYIYDDMDNWIEQKITIDGQDMYVVKRVYKYQ